MGPRQSIIDKNTVVVFGAGATKACGGPLTNEILPEAFEVAKVIEREDYVSTLNEFLRDNFYLPFSHEERHPDHYPPLPLLLSLIDKAIDKRESFGAKWGTRKLADVRAALDYVIFACLDHYLRRINNHYASFLWALQEMTGGKFKIISLNYDIIVDNSLIKLGEKIDMRGFPDYVCDISTDAYLHAPKTWKLLKIHGSLNWLYCPNCQRLDIGITESDRPLEVSNEFHKTLEELFIEQPLEKGYSCHGKECPECNTFVRPVMITPTHLKDYRNPHISRVWHKAERYLREAESVIFVGYSMPEDDLDVIYLLKRGLAEMKRENITVVEYAGKNLPRELDKHPVGKRYRTLFGDKINWQADGFEEYIAGLS